MNYSLIKFLLHLILNNMAFDQKEQEIIKFGLENGKTRQEVEQAISNYRAGVVPERTTPPKTTNYVDRVTSSFAQNLDSAKQDLFSSDSRKPISKAISTVSNVTSALASPITEAPIIKQAGEIFSKGLNYTGEQLSKLYSPEFSKELAQMSDEEFKIATQPLQDISNAGNIANNILLARGGQKTGEIIRDKTAKLESLVKTQSELIKPPEAITQVVKDLTPTKEALRDKAFARAFRLAPVEDLSRIEQLTGQKPAAWLDKYNLYKNTPAETATQIAKFKRQNINLVDDTISLITDKFTFESLPELKTTIDYLSKDLSKLKSAPYKQVLDRMNSIKQKGEFDLSDAQYIKQAFDDIESIYKRTGDVKEKIIAKDMAQTISPVRRFIEDRVKEVYPQIDIRSLNNNIQTSSAILDAIVKRAPKAETSSLFQLGDMAVIGVGNQIVPGTGFAALFGKKVIESSPIQLRIAQWLSGKTKDLTKGMSLDDIKKANQFIQEELMSSLDESIVTKLEKGLKETQNKLSQ